jgi:hypothetical protein
VEPVISLVVKRPGRGTDHSPPASAEVKKCGSIHPPPIRLHGVVKHRDNFTFNGSFIGTVLASSIRMTSNDEKIKEQFLRNYVEGSTHGPI